ncbi:MAG: hypothetical protein H7062_22760 [Candidatus Saccharimonas sp.]|nr:hypothetical protein [Planctomycetaceae bacterium]
MQLLTKAQQLEVRSAGDTPARLVDPETNAEYVVVPAALFERFRSLVTDDPLTDEEEINQLREAGELAGWNDPEMAAYDQLDPRRQP